MTVNRGSSGVQAQITCCGSSQPNGPITQRHISHGDESSASKISLIPYPFAAHAPLPKER